MRLEVDSVENFSKGSPTDISDAHALLKVRNLLRKPNISATTDEIILHDLLLHYRRIYESLPATMKAKPEINANPLELRHAEQFIVICGAFPCAASHELAESLRSRISWQPRRVGATTDFA